MNPDTCDSGASGRAPASGGITLLRLPLGATLAHGWLGEQLRLAADGLGGRLGEVWDDVGPHSAWLGGDGESWERGPYYARGLVALAHALGDAELIARTRPWVDWTLASQDDDGFFGPRENRDWWARMPMLEALCLHAEATGDARVAPFLARYFRHQLAELPARPLADWGRPRGADNAASALWLHSRTGDATLLELADLLLAQSTNWLAELGRDGAPGDAFEVAHGVNRAMGLKLPSIAALRGEPAALAALRRGWSSTLEHHGQVHGMFSCDEFLHGRGETQGTELCAVVETLSSLHLAQAVAGETWIADAIERIALNALPATIAADHRSHQYFQQVNQIACTPGGHGFQIHHETDLLFGVATGYGCCAANYHLGWPAYASHLWYATRDGGIAAMQLAPSTVRFAAGGIAVRLRQETDYPFGSTVRFVFEGDAPAAFPLTVRIPGWAETARIETPDGRCAEIVRSRGDVPESGLVTAARTWRPGDAVTLELPMRPRVSLWNRGAIAVEHGPLVYALPVAEDWRPVAGRAPFFDYELHPRSEWAYALRLDADAPERGLRVVERPLARQPWARSGASRWIAAPAQRVRGWDMEAGSAAPVPGSPVAIEGEAETVFLVPYGCARLRVALLPVAG